MVYLGIIGLIGLFGLQSRTDRVVSWLMFLAISMLCLDNYLKPDIYAFSFLWNSSEIGNITIDFMPDVLQNKEVSLVFFLTVLSILYNNIFRYEEHRSSFNSLIIFNLISLCLLISSKNYVQLLTAVFVTDILGYLVIKDVDSSRRYVIYNFFADICLFMILALARSQLKSLDIEDISEYARLGKHQDFISIILFVSLLIKTGGFLFEGYLLDLIDSRFQRITTIQLLFSPLAGILLITKLHSLLFLAPLIVQFFTIEYMLTYLLGIVGLVASSNIKRKVIYLNLSFIGTFLLLLIKGNFIWNDLLSFYYLAMFICNVLFFMIYLYQNREENISNMLNSSIVNTKAMKSLLVLMVLWINLFVSLSINIANDFMYKQEIVYTVFIVLGIVFVLGQIYKSPHARRLDSLKRNSWRALAFFLNGVLLLIQINYFKAYTWQNVLLIITVLLLISLPINTKTRAIYNKHYMLANTWDRVLFNKLLVQPIKSFSRLLWVSVDFVFSEKIVTAFFYSINKLMISCFFLINKRNITAYISFVILGILIFILVFYRSRLI